MTVCVSLLTLQILKEVNSLLDPQAELETPAEPEAEAAQATEPETAEKDEDADAVKEAEGAKGEETAVAAGGADATNEEPDFNEEDENEVSATKEKAGNANTSSTRGSYQGFWIKGVPPRVSVAELTAALAEVEGFVRVATQYPGYCHDSRTRRLYASFKYSIEYQTLYTKVKDAMKAAFPNIKIQPHRHPLEVKVPGDKSTFRKHPSDSALIVKLIQMFDNKYNTWSDSENPVLASTASDDKRILYLRIVYCYDFYNGAEEIFEDDMPNRVGSMYVRRDEDPLSKVPSKPHFRTFARARLAAEIEPSPSQIESMDRSEEDSLKAFIEKNTAEVPVAGKPAFKCLLLYKDEKNPEGANKIFSSKEYVTKHILGKHVEKVETAKQDAAMFNNYTRDTLRIRRMPGHIPLEGGALAWQPVRAAQKQHTPNMYYFIWFLTRHAG